MGNLFGKKCVAGESTPDEDDEYYGKEPIIVKEEGKLREESVEEQNKNKQKPGIFSGVELGSLDEKDIKKILSKLKEREEFHDPKFPPAESSLFYSNRESSYIKWLRPKELVKSPSLYVDEADKADVIQGDLGDCWFLSACASLAMQPKLLHKLISPEQLLSGDEYNGAIVCKFWRYGQWVDVLIDDYLPTNAKELLYGKCSSKREFWLPLLEKAYAKLHGTYEALEGGYPMDALTDLTGGFAERFDVTVSNVATIFKHLFRSSKAGAFITCSKQGDWTLGTVVDKNGLVGGHAYSITGVFRVQHSTRGVVDLLRIRNPWGNDVEWTGAWNEKDSLWDGVSEGAKERLNLSNKADGEFWMGLEDFAQQFQEVAVCNLGPDYDLDGMVDKVAKILIIKGEWKRGVNAGGCRNNITDFATNPQYLLHVRKAERKGSFGSIRGMIKKSEPMVATPDSEVDLPNHNIWAIISLMQEHRRSSKYLSMEMLQIGFVVYKVKREKIISAEEFRFRRDFATSGDYINLREVSARVELSPGYYIIVPATYLAGKEANFMIRIFSSSPYVKLTKLR